MIKLVRGFKDILPADTALWQHVEGVVRELLEDFGFAELRIPVLEQTELFARSIGAGTDIVEKEMYTFTDRGGASLSLRPEATASVVRAYVEHRMYAKDPVCKLYTIGPMFRRERPQRGRYRQFHQINAEIFGLHDPRTDAELILLLMTFFGRLELGSVALHINSLGCPECRPRFKDALKLFLAGRPEEFCSDCLRRKDENPLRLFDCKVPDCKEAMQEAPSILDDLCEACSTHFDDVKRSLDRFQIPYQINNRLVRGLDYYTRTTFEVLGESLGAQDAVAGGGRYDGLVKALGGPNEPGVGFAVGVDRLMELLAGRAQDFEKRPHIFVAAIGETAQDMAFEWVQGLRLQGVRTEMDFENRSLKSQMRRADKLGASYVVIVGDRELDEGVAIFRDMATKEQEQVVLQEVVGTAVDRIRTSTVGGES
ncbi:MAG: histidine--tRNA ligase [Deltaproteobacteria bacterium]|nr:histidine--tRNA ligase [Deltaproteobacteria bacterium]MBW2172200.1 histidine--tRNA ligase [Deltaproteobacteria bacterium]MBW2259875.1 histidine--tRNA ligase [Deltaproteobacteria bacterium]